MRGLLFRLGRRASINDVRLAFQNKQRKGKYEKWRNVVTLRMSDKGNFHRALKSYTETSFKEAKMLKKKA